MNNADLCSQMPLLTVIKNTNTGGGHCIQYKYVVCIYIILFKVVIIL